MSSATVLVFTLTFSFFFFVFGGGSYCVFLADLELHYIDQAVFEFTEICLPLLLSQNAGIKSFTTTHSLNHYDAVSLESQIKVKPVTLVCIVPKIHIILPHRQILITL